MLSVADLVDIVGAAEAFADQHQFRELVAYLDGHPDIVSDDPTLQYLAAYGAYMTGREGEARDRLMALASDTQVGRYDRLYRRILNLHAIMEIEAGQLGGAFGLLDELEDLAWSATDYRYVAYATLNKGITLEIVGRTEDAISEILRAKLAFHKLGDQRSIAACSHNLAMAHRTLKQYWLAESLFELAVDIFTKHKCVEERLSSQIELAHCIALSGDHARAESYVRAALAEATTQENPRLIAEAQRVLGGLNRRLGRLDSAQPLLSAALALATEADLTSLKCEVLTELALIANLKGNVEKASSLLGEVSTALKSMGAVARARDTEMLLKQMVGKQLPTERE